MRLHRRSGAPGASIIEFALILPVLAMIVMGVLDLGRAYRLQIRLDGAAHEGATHAFLFPNDVDCTGTDDIVGHVADADATLPNETAYAVAVLGEDGAGDLTVTVSGCGGTTVDAGERVRVEVRATYEILTPLVAAVVGSNIAMTGRTEVEVLG